MAPAPHPQMRSFMSALFVLSTCSMCSFGCSGCSKDKPKPGTESQKKASKKTSHQIDAGALDPLASAKAEAHKFASDTGIARMDLAQAVTSNIETAKASEQKGKRPKIRIKTKSEVKGRIDAKRANRVFRDFDGAMKKCYERSLKRNPGLSGKIRLTLLIDRSGKVKTARARSSSLADKNVHRCIESNAKRMKFPKPKGGMAKVAKNYKFTPAF